MRVGDFRKLKKFDNEQEENKSCQNLYVNYWELMPISC